MLCPDVTNIDILSDAVLTSHSTNSMSTYCKNNLSLNDFISEKIGEQQQHILTVVPIDKEAPSSDK